MNTRRIHLQPGECVEIINSYGTSVLKAVTRFDGEQACVILFEQPDIITLDALEAKTYDLSFEPIPSLKPITDQTGLSL